jgi:protein SCO1/2/putative membrane protein
MLMPLPGVSMCDRGDVPAAHRPEGAGTIRPRATPWEATVSRHYGVGLQIVLATILVSSVICLFGATRVPPRAARVAQDLGASAQPLGPFQLEERSGRTVTADDLADRVAIASFIFTRCPLSCPRISSVMQGLQRRLAGTDVLLVSFSVDPEHDTPAVLRQYAERYGASPNRWWFLTGPKSIIYGLIGDRFKLGVMEAAGPPGSDTEWIVHSDRLALIDHGRIVGLFDSTDPEAVDALVAQARRRALPAWVARLPSFNAGLNGLSACLLIAGWILIRRYLAGLEPGGQVALPKAGSQGGIWAQPLVKAHIACMVSAVCTSTLFLACYLYYHYRAGSVSYSQGGTSRLIYLSILLSHTLLATASVPLILLAVTRGWRGQHDRHVSIASVTFPIWIYVAVTGVVIYVMLYHLPVLQFGPSSGM